LSLAWPPVFPIPIPSVTAIPITAISPIPASASWLSRALRHRFVAGYAIDVLMFLQKIRDIKKRVPLKAQVDKRGLHSRQNARDASLVNAARQRILVGALEVNLDELIVFNQRDSCLVPIGRDH